MPFCRTSGGCELRSQVENRAGGLKERSGTVDLTQGTFRQRLYEEAQSRLASPSPGIASDADERSFWQPLITRRRFLGKAAGASLAFGSGCWIPGIARAAGSGSDPNPI